MCWDYVGCTALLHRKTEAGVGNMLKQKCTSVLGGKRLPPKAVLRRDLEHMLWNFWRTKIWLAGPSKSIEMEATGGGLVGATGWCTTVQCKYACLYQTYVSRQGTPSRCSPDLAGQPPAT
jgi:hypothetical protein